MVIRWIFYVLALIGCIIFFAAYQLWIACLLLILVGSAPMVSLLLSLAFMLWVRPRVENPGAITVGSPEMLNIAVSSPLPLPPFRCRFRVSHSLTGKKLLLRPGDALPTEHCGRILCHSTGFYVYDFLNLFRIRLRRIPDKYILVRPRPIPMDTPQDLERFLSLSWQPKYGGGFAENHELRLYRPGDGLNQVHWKLSAKTGKLIIREPMVPRHGKLLLTMDLQGTPAEMDRKLGKLLWMGNHLLEKGLRYQIHANTRSGVEILPVCCENDLTQALDTLLSRGPAAHGTVLKANTQGAWCYHIGGDADEA